MTTDLKELALAATPGPWFVHDFADPAVSSKPSAADVTVSCDHPATITVAAMGGGLDGIEGIEQARKDAAFIAAANPSAILNLIRERDEARAQVKAYKLMQLLDEDSAYAIRELLNRHNVPAAAFLDDHVANAIAQRDAAEAALTAERAEVARYKIALADATRRPMGVLPASAEGLITAADMEAAEAGATEQQIMAMTGHTTSKEVNRYTKAARKKVLAEQAGELFKTHKI